MKDWKVVNLDKMEYIAPDSFGEEPEHIALHDLTALALMYLTITPVGFAGLGGITPADGTAIGHWCGDRVAVVSAETQDGDIPGVHGAGSIHGKCIKRSQELPWAPKRVPTGVKGEFKNISGWVRKDLVANNKYPKKDTLPVVISYNGIEYRR